MHALLEKLFKPQATPTPPSDALRLASALLLFEVIRADGTLTDSETEALLDTLEKRWQLDRNAAIALRDTVHQQADHATDIHQFTRLLRDHWSYAERTTLIDNMWRLANSDGRIDPEEEYVIRKVADLLYVDHSDFIRAKIKALTP